MPIVARWFFRYVVVGLFAYFFKRKEPRILVRGLYLHLFIVVSLGLLMHAGARIEWGMSPIAIGIFAAAVLGATYLLGEFGMGYAISSVLQDWCLLLSATYLASQVGAPIAAAATSIPFMLIHRTEGTDWYWKPWLLFSWCLISFYLYLILEQPLINMAIHTIVGAALIKKRLLHKYEDEL